MRRDIEFTSGGETVRGWLYTPDGGDGPVPGRRHGRRLVLRQGARAAARRAGVRRHRARRDSLRLPQLRRRATGRAASTSIRTRRSRTTGTPSRSPRRSTRSTPNGSAVWGLSYSGGHALILGATDPRVKCVSAQIPVVDGYRNMRRVHGTMGFRQLRAGAAGRPASPLRRAARTDSSPTRRRTRPRRSRPGRSPRPTRRSASSSRARRRPTRTGARSNPPSS